jgi:DNA-binding transcriptional regulator YiaG
LPHNRDAQRSSHAEFQARRTRCSDLHHLAEGRESMLNEFKDKLRFLREQKDLTQRKMAEVLGVSLRSYVSYENGTS